VWVDDHVGADSDEQRLAVRLGGRSGAQADGAGRAALVSMMICWPATGVMTWASSRALMSVLPPAHSRRRGDRAVGQAACARRADGNSREVAPRRARGGA